MVYLQQMAASTERREGINQLSQQLRASLYSYDEVNNQYS